MQLRWRFLFLTSAMQTCETQLQTVEPLIIEIRISSYLVQLLYPESKPGQRYLIDAECYNGGVPYCDHFYTLIRYCMTRVGRSSTRLNITGQVVYLKSIFMLKGTTVNFSFVLYIGLQTIPLSLTVSWIWSFSAHLNSWIEFGVDILWNICKLWFLLNDTISKFIRCNHVLPLIPNSTRAIVVTWLEMPRGRYVLQVFWTQKKQSLLELIKYLSVLTHWKTLVEVLTPLPWKWLVHVYNHHCADGY